MTYRFGVFEFDSAAGELRRDGRKVALERSQRALIEWCRAYPARQCNAARARPPKLAGQTAMTYRFGVFEFDAGELRRDGRKVRARAPASALPSNGVEPYPARQCDASAQAGAAREAAMTYRFGVFEFDSAAGELRRDGRKVALERQPARALERLLAGAGTVVTRDELKAAVWENDTHVDFDRGLAYCLSHIRQALGDSGENPRFVQTLPRKGYRFIAPVSTAALPVAAPRRSMRLDRRSGGSRAARGGSVDRATSVSVVIAVSIFDNETGMSEHDRLVSDWPTWW